MSDFCFLIQAYLASASDKTKKKKDQDSDESEDDDDHQDETFNAEQYYEHFVRFYNMNTC